MSGQHYEWIAADQVKKDDTVKFAGQPLKVNLVMTHPGTKKLHISVEKETYPGIPVTTYIVEPWQELEVLQDQNMTKPE